MASNLVHPGSDSIPREYHRKILKKIAQLTKVIYTLNTKNDENEQFIMKLKATYEADASKLLSDCTKKLQQCQSQFSLEKETAEREMVGLRESLRAAEEEQEQFHQEQVSYRKLVEDKLADMKSCHSHKVLLMTQQLEKLKKEQVQQLKEITELHEEVRKKYDNKVQVMEEKHQEVLDRLKEELGEASLATITSLKAQHRREIEGLKQDLETQVENEKLKHHKTMLEAEEKEKNMREKIVQNEDSLKQQISTLSTELRTSRDRLALSEQKVKELLSQFEQGQASSAGLETQLKDALQEAEKLKAALREVQIELDVSREHYKQQTAELKEMAASMGKLEALRVSYEGTMENLNSQIVALQKKLELLEDEKSALECSQLSNNEQLTTQIKRQKMEVEKVRREKEDMRLQFAREIEAAHAQLGEKESELGHQHLKAIQQLKAENEQALLNAKKEKDAALQELRAQLESQKAEELLCLEQRLEGENTNLKTALTDKSCELELAEEEVKRLESELARREQGLGSAATSLKKLKDDFMAAREEVRTAQKEKEGLQKEKSLLQSTVKSMKEQVRQKDKTHQENMETLRSKLTRELEENWKEKLVQECGVVRQELSTRHKEDTAAALSELAALKDEAMRQAKETWGAKERLLMSQIEELSRKLQELQVSASATLEETKTASSDQITTLRKKLKEQEKQHTSLMEELKHLHTQETEALQKKWAAQKKLEIGSMREQHTRDLQEIQQANQLAVETLRQMLEKQHMEKIAQAKYECEKEGAERRAELMAEHEREKEKLSGEYESKVERHQREAEKIMAERKNETACYEGTLKSLNSDIERRDAELNKLRNKVSSQTVAINNMSKELEIKGHEVLTIRRETTALLKQRVGELSAVHSAEMESLAAQHKQECQMLLMQFNNAKALSIRKIQELEKQVAEWEQRYTSRESKPEDLEAIRELQLLTEHQRVKMKDLIAEKRVYELELMNREKNYNQVFNANPCVGVINPLAPKHKKATLEIAGRYPSAPSLMLPTPEPHPPAEPYPFPPSASSTHTLIPRNHSISSDTSSTNITSNNGSHHLQKNSPPLDTRSRKLLVLRESPLTQKKHLATAKEKQDSLGTPFKHLEQLPPPGSNQKHYRNQLLIDNLEQ